MKKLVYGSLFLVLVGIGFSGCKKEEMVNMSNSPDQYSGKSMGDLTSSITVENGMLKFRDMEHIKRTIDGLYNSYLNHEDDFLSFYPDKSGEELMKIEDSISFNEYKPYEEFEVALSFSSLRSKIQQDYIEYMNSGRDDNSDPENHFIIEKSIQTVLNTHEEVIIGESIYKFYEGGYIRIVDGNYSTLLLIRKDFSLVYKLDNVEVEGGVEFFDNKSASCRGHKGRTGKKDSGSRRIKWRIAIQTYPWNRYVIAESTNYLKQGNRWKKFRCHTKCRVWGEISDYEEFPDGTKEANCDKPFTFNTQNGVFSDKYNTKSWQHKVFVSTRTKSGWVKGYHYSFIGSTMEHESTLTW